MAAVYGAHPDLQVLIHSVIYLIRGAIFRPRHGGGEAVQSGSFSLDICPLSELVDMYHNRKATERRDKVYALLGMSSDDPAQQSYRPTTGSHGKKSFGNLSSSPLLIRCLWTLGMTRRQQ